jgi:hypothetical protein
MTCASVSTVVFFADPFWFQKITVGLHILAHINIVRPEDKYPKLKIYILELILDI